MLILNGGNNSQVGLTRSFAVMPGDTVRAEVYAKYIGSAGGSGNLTNFAAALTDAFDLNSGQSGEFANAFQALNAFGAFIAGGDRDDDDNDPKGFITILVFNKDYELVDLSFDQLDAASYVQSGGTKAPHDLLTAQITARELGYVYVFLSNEGSQQLDIGFDDYEITYVPGPVVQMDDYYPFGLTFNSYQRENSTKNKGQLEMGITSIADLKRMLLFFQKIKHLVYGFMLMLSIGACSSAPSSEDIVQEFYTRAKEHQSELSVLFNVSFTARGTRNDKPLIPRLAVALNEHETITLPGIDSDMTDEEIQNLPFFENMKIYSQRIGLSDSIAYQHVKDYCQSIVELAHTLEAYKVQSTPRLGRFIIFSLTPEDQIIYIPDVSDVDNDYWKNFFKTGRKIQDHWYVRSIESSEE